MWSAQAACMRATAARSAAIAPMAEAMAGTLRGGSSMPCSAGTTMSGMAPTFVAMTMSPDGNLGKGRYMLRVMAPGLAQELEA